MAEAIKDYVRELLSFSWLTGPVFDKELRVSSRQRRSYVLRFAYISLLLTILFFVWVNVVDYRGTNVIRVSRMAQAGKYIVTCIVWFQFCAAQIIAVIMLSNSISDEIYHKTLGMLMTTPVTSVQIVLGKLLSKLLQLLLLLAISFPLLAIVRMFGGVPWSFVVSSLCMTLTTVLFVSSISLFYSIFCRRAYVVIIATVLTLLVLFALMPFLFVTFLYFREAYRHIPERLLLFVLYEPNPYLAFFYNTMTMTNPRTVSGPFYLSPYLNSGFILALSLLLLLLSIIMVRKVALRQAVGQLLSPREKKSGKTHTRSPVRKAKGSAAISVVGPPVFWKELILPLRKRSRIYRMLGASIFLVLLFYSYWFFIKVDAIGQDATQVCYALIFMGLGTLFTLVLSATSITAEKESRAWPLLLTSTLNDRQIIFGKFCGILSRCFPMWTVLVGHVIVFAMLGILHPSAVPLTLILVSWFVILITSSGLYFSSVFKRTTTAVIMNFLFVLLIWGIIPLILGIFSVGTQDSDAVEGSLSINPFIQIIVIMISTVQRRLRMRAGQIQFDWPRGLESAKTTFTIFIVSFFIYMTLALIFLWRAKRDLRRKIF